MTFSRQHAVTAALLAGLTLLAACGDKELQLPGERLNVRAPLTADGAPLDASVAEAAAAPVPLAGAEQTAGTRPVPITLPGTIGNAEWTHRGGSAARRIGNAAFSGQAVHVWSANVGQGSTRRNRISADPVVGGGRIYTLDADAGVTATATNGAVVWRADLTPPADRVGEGSGGGVAYDGGRVYATTGFGELVALDAAAGSVIWRQKFDAAIGGAPTVSGALVFVAARDATAWAVRASDGKVQWQLPGTPAAAGVTGVSAPAVADGTVAFPFASGQIIATDIQTGTPVWQANISGARLGRAYASVGDLTGDPVIADGVLYAGSAAGRLGAYDMATGRALWAAGDGAVSPPVIAGGSVFIINDENQLERLDVATGAVVWRIDLPYFTKDRDKKRRDIFVHYGPTLAGGRLWTASSDGYLRAFDPASGAVTAAVAIPGGAASSPVVAGGTLYVLSGSGQLHAFR